jgi:hypothetical protein
MMDLWMLLIFIGSFAVFYGLILWSDQMVRGGEE